MAVPTINSIIPATGPTGGGTLVDVRGTGFRVPPLPPPVGPVLPLPPTVAVLVGGTRARDVCVLTADRLTMLTPLGALGPVDIAVFNLDDRGIPIAGEEVVSPGAYRYALPRLTVESDLTRLVRTLLRELKRQVHPNVSLTTQTDFDAETGDGLHVTELASLPGLVLVGPELRENRFYSQNAASEVPDTDGTVLRRRAPYTVDLGFTLIGVADHTTELLNLMAATELFFHRNPYLEIDRDPVDPTAGRVRYEMEVTPDGDLRVTSQPNESNVRSFSGSFVIRGFDLEDGAGVVNDAAFARTVAVDAVAVAPPQQLAPTVPVGRNPDP